jgi:hypothetical protein
MFVLKTKLALRKAVFKRNERKMAEINWRTKIHKYSQELFANRISKIGKRLSNLILRNPKCQEIKLEIYKLL